MRFSCPQCQTQLEADASAAGQAVQCPGCNSSLTVPADPAAGAGAAVAAGAAGAVAAGAAVAPAVSPPAPSVPRPNIAAAPSVPQPAAVAAAAPAPSVPTPTAPVSEPAAPEPDTHAATSGGPRPIEYFMPSKGGNIAQVSFWMSLAIGVGIAGAWYLILWIAMPDGSYLKELFMERSWVQYATTFLSGWTLGILILKTVHIKKQNSAFNIDIVPTDISPEVNMYNVADFYDHVIHIPKSHNNTFLVRRIRKGLEYFYVRESNTEVASMMSSQSDIDANSIAGSYALTKVFLWAIPIMGFIGTVLGIGGAIGEFATTLSNASDPDAMMNGLQKVLGGLGTAFDTTFLALVFSILLMIPASSVQASEEDAVNSVDEYCNDHLIKRLNDGGAGAQLNDAAAIKALGEVLEQSNTQIVGKFSDIHGNMAEVYEKQTEHYQTVAQAVDTQLKAIEQRASTYESKLDVDINKSVANLAEGIKNLNHVLKDLDGKQIVVKKKLFGIFG